MSNCPCSICRFGSNAAEENQHTLHTNPKYPLWVHVTRYNTAGGDSGRGGISRFKCHFCDEVFLGSYSRVRAHLLKISGSGVKICNKIAHPVLEQLHEEDREATANI